MECLLVQVIDVYGTAPPFKVTARTIDPKSKIEDVMEMKKPKEDKEHLNEEEEQELKKHGVDDCDMKDDEEEEEGAYTDAAKEEFRDFIDDSEDESMTEEQREEFEDILANDFGSKITADILNGKSKKKEPEQSKPTEESTDDDDYDPDIPLYEGEENGSFGSDSDTISVGSNKKDPGIEDEMEEVKVETKKTKIEKKPRKPKSSPPPAKPRKPKAPPSPPKTVFASETIELSGPAVKFMTSPLIIFSVLAKSADSNSNNNNISKRYTVVRILDGIPPQDKSLSHLSHYIKKSKFYGSGSESAKIFQNSYKKFQPKVLMRDQLDSSFVSKIQDPKLQNIFRFSFLDQETLRDLLKKVSLFDIHFEDATYIPDDFGEVYKSTNLPKSFISCCVRYTPHVEAWKSLDPEPSEEAMAVLEAGALCGKYRKNLEMYGSNYLEEKKDAIWSEAAVNVIKENGEYHIGVMPVTCKRCIQSSKSIESETRVAQWIASKKTYVVQAEDDSQMITTDRKTGKKCYTKLATEIGEIVIKNNPHKWTTVCVVSSDRKTVYEILRMKQMTLKELLNSGKLFGQIVFDRSHNLTISDLEKIASMDSSENVVRKLVFLGSAVGGTSYNSPFRSMLALHSDTHTDSDKTSPCFFVKQYSDSIPLDDVIFHESIGEATLEVTKKNQLASIIVPDFASAQKVKSGIMPEHKHIFSVYTPRDNIEFRKWCIIDASSMTKETLCKVMLSVSVSSIIIVGDECKVREMARVEFDSTRNLTPFSYLLSNSRTNANYEEIH